MKTWWVALSVCLFSCLAQSLRADESKATARWFSESGSAEPGQTLQTMVELRVEKGWHVYWVNPGEAGMPTSVSWELPEGFSCGPLIHPWPVCFTSGGLTGYGHEGLVRYPVVVTMPDDFSGVATLRGELRWLSCNDDSCVPGSAALELELASGRSTPGPRAAEVSQAHAQAVAPAPAGMQLQVADEGQAWKLLISGDRALRAVGARAMMATPERCQPGQAIKFQLEKGNAVTARVNKSEYAPEQVGSLELWLWPEGSERPMVLRSAAAQPQ